MKVNRYDYASQFPDSDKLFAEIQNMLLSGSYVMSKELESFEAHFAKYLGRQFCVGVNSGTDALVLALTAAGIGPGDEVITQANTFYATVLAIHRVGATPVLVDVCPQSYLINPESITEAISEKTKVIMPVHLYGKPTPMAPIMALAQAHGLIVIEDAAQAHGATWRNQRVGSFGHMGCFSFHPSKNLAAAGDGGCIVVDEAKFDEKLRILRNLGQKNQNQHILCGFNTKLDAIQARILEHKLNYLDAWNADRRRIAEKYRHDLANLPIRFQRTDPNEEHVYHLFQLETPKRDELMHYLRSEGVDATIRYPVPIHQQEAFQHFTFADHFPVSERLSRELVCLPIRPGMPDSEIEYVVNLIHKFFEEKSQ